jgi:hypothetical protein
MKLRAPSPPQQLLFPAAFALLVLGEMACAQAPQAVVKLKTGTTQQGVITQVTPSGVAMQMSGGQSATLPLNLIESVQMAAPAEYGQALQAIQQKDLAKAASLVGALANKFKGLPTDWAQQATALVGDLAVQSGDLSKAESAYTEFRKLYPGGGSTQAEVGMAAIAASKKDFASAKEKIAPIVAAALKEQNAPVANRFAYSRAFFVSGQVKESEGNKPGALEDYLRTVTIFYHDAAAVSAAQERADALRKEKITVP